MERKLEEWRRRLEEARRIREEHADWSFIQRQPQPLKAALLYYIKTGDIRIAARIAQQPIARFRELLREANIPTVS
ncbi:MAG: hypothetical protein DRN96_07385 [Thermoproteota archaeon]|nr:MAG: hypothetical protein DRN96_07385 [Candidatus Korarchaeota archaeon]